MRFKKTMIVTSLAVMMALAGCGGGSTNTAAEQKCDDAVIKVVENDANKVNLNASMEDMLASLNGCTRGQWIASATAHHFPPKGTATKSLDDFCGVFVSDSPRAC